MRRTQSEDGFTLVEVVIAAGIIAGVIASFTVFLENVAQIQTSSTMSRTAARVVGGELEKLAGANWDDVMSPPLNVGGQGCQITPKRKSLQIAFPGPVTVTNAGLDISITRNVVWAKTLSAITDATNNISTITYTADNSFVAGQVISIYNMVPRQFNFSNVTVAAATPTQFTITKSISGSFAQGGWAGVSVYCSGTKDSPDLKVLNVSGAWRDGGINRTKSLTVFLSRWTEGKKVI